MMTSSFYVWCEVLIVCGMLTSHKGQARSVVAQPSCPEGLWGEACGKLCAAGCRLGCNRLDGTCVGGCGPGWTGNHCQHMCANFRFGVDCRQSCGHCRDDRPCNIVTGRCSDGCIAGFQGVSCHKGCEPFTYGINCNQTCGQCRQGQACNRVTGQCSGGCGRGWLGDRCQQACPKGYHGLDCSQPCGKCAGNSSCDHVTGKCLEGCQDGWSGQTCMSACQSGHYGPGCQYRCGRCQKGYCDHVTGECHGGCSRGFHGDTCKAECPNGTFGENCSSKCGNCDVTLQGCDPVTGLCLGGCMPGTYGILCRHNCSAGTFGTDCKFVCGRCKGDADCDATTGVCLGGCDVGWDGERCDQGILQMATSLPSTPIFPVLIISLVVAVIIIFTFFIYFVCIRPRKHASRRLYIQSSCDPLTNTYEQIVGSPWEIPRGQLLLGSEFLGNGQFGQVKKGHVKINGSKIPVAIKSLKDNASEKDKGDFMSELSILKTVGKNTNVVCLVGACHIKGVMYVAMEYAKHGDLRSFLRKSRHMTTIHEYDNTTSPFLHTAIRPQLLIKLSLDTAKGLQHLADKQIIHRDVAARNVLLADKLVAKIADFGLSKNDQTYVKTSITRVPIRWMAMESLFNYTYTLQSDVWAFGVLLWEVFTLGGTPYSSTDSQQLFSFLKEGHRLRKPRLCDQDMYSMMLQCWHESPDRRPNIEELVGRLGRMMENTEVYMNLDVQEETLYTEIDHSKET